MAWAMYTPDVGRFSVLGEFICTLDGKELSWEERLAHAWDNEMTEEQKSFKNCQDRHKYIVSAYRKLGTGATAPSVFGPLWDHEKPDIYVLQKPMKEILPFSFWDTAALLADERVLQIIRSLEPDANEIWPITVRTKRGKEYAGPLYAIVVTQVRDSIILEETDHVTTINEGVYRVDGWTAGSPGKITASTEKRDGAHLWLEQNFLGPQFMMSDALRDALKAAEVPLYKMRKAKEV